MVFVDPIYIALRFQSKKGLNLKKAQKDWDCTRIEEYMRREIDRHI